MIKHKNKKIIVIIILFMIIYTVWRVIINYRIYNIYLPKVGEIWKCYNSNIEIICVKNYDEYCIGNLIYDGKTINDIYIQKWYTKYDISEVKTADDEKYLTTVFNGEFLFKYKNKVYIKGTSIYQNYKGYFCFVIE